jgi:biopolymer transport protein TolR
MGMSVGGHGGKMAPKSDINVTPLVDVVLVLLIIFMAATPLLTMGYGVAVPPKAPEGYIPPPSAIQDQVVVNVTADGKIYINQDQVAQTAFPLQISEIIRNRQTKMVFFSCNERYNYGEAMKIMDTIRHAGPKDKPPVQVGIILQPIAPTPAG